MARGLPDDSNIVKEGPTWTLTDHAELAARLGSIVTFDRLGTVIDLETFVKGRSRWASNIWGAGGAICLSNYRSLVDGVSLKLLSGTGVTPAVQAVWYLPYPELSRLGYEASYCLFGNLYRVYHMLNVFKGTYFAYFGIRWTVTTGVIEYRDLGAVWVDTGYNVVPAPHTYLFNRIKLVGNALTEEYERMLINDQGFSLKGNYAEQVVSPDDPHIQACSQVWGDGIANMTTYLDACIFTETEPATP